MLFVAGALGLSLFHQDTFHQGPASFGCCSGWGGRLCGVLSQHCGIVQFVLQEAAGTSGHFGQSGFVFLHTRLHPSPEMVHLVQFFHHITEKRVVFEFLLNVLHQWTELLEEVVVGKGDVGCGGCRGCAGCEGCGGGVGWCCKGGGCWRVGEGIG